MTSQTPLHTRSNFEGTRSPLSSIAPFQVPIAPRNDHVRARGSTRPMPMSGPPEPENPLVHHQLPTSLEKCASQVESNTGPFRDWVPYSEPYKFSELQPSFSDSASTISNLANVDRFITTRENKDTFKLATLETIPFRSGSPGHTARISEATGIHRSRRILSYHEHTPRYSSDTSLAQQRIFVKALYSVPQNPASTSSVDKSRRLSTNSKPEQILRATGVLEDYYLNPLSWSCRNEVAIGLSDNIYIWRPDSRSIIELCESREISYVSSVEHSNDGTLLGVGTGDGKVELWDLETGKKTRTMRGHQAQVASLSWHQHILSSGCQDGSIWHHDVRAPRHKVMELLGHKSEVCGLLWRVDGELLASGGNDNIVNIWDGRLGDVGEGARGSAKYTKRKHVAAVKALAWCPWQPSLLASGGGTLDATVNVWNTNTGACVHSLQTPGQITSIQWCPHRKEFLTTHGYPVNSMMIHAYPSMERIGELKHAHGSRILFSALGPAGDMICTGAADDFLKFWRVWDGPHRKENMEVGRPSSTTNSKTLILR